MEIYDFLQEENGGIRERYELTMGRIEEILQEESRSVSPPFDG